MRVRRLYDFLPSGNGYKVRLLLHQLEIPYERVELDILRGETRTPEFLARNPNGRIPVLELHDGSCFAESNAILWLLSDRTPFLPDAPLERAHVLQWMFFEQYSHEPYIAVSRFWRQHPEASAPLPGLAEQKLEGGYRALDVMEAQLTKQPYLVSGRYSIADVALYAYTHVAHEGGFDLAHYPALRDWLERVRAEPRHIPITRG